jgi:tetratricopeptide (TPR) repeat protein
MYRKLFILSILISILLISVSCKSKKEKADKLVVESLIKTDKSDFKGAIQDLDKAIQYDSLNSKSWFLRGNLKISLQQIDKAILDYDRAIALNDKDMNAYYNRGYAYFLLGNQEKACENFFIAYKMGKPNIEDKIKNCKEIQ